MKRIFFLLCSIAALWGGTPATRAQPPTDAPVTVPSADAAERTTEAAAAVASGAAKRTAHPPHFLQHMVDTILEMFDVRTGENTVTHYVISMVLLLGAFFLRRVVTGIVFTRLKKIAAKTETTLDDKLIPALEAPAATFVLLVGIFAAFEVLRLSEESEQFLAYASTVSFSLVVFWALLRAFNALLDHAHEVAREKQMGVAAFMPWIRKTLVAVFVVIGALMIIQTLGYGENVKTLLAGLGIGGLAFALAAQDTIANLFGSIVVAIDQPFKIGEAVRIGSNEGVVEDIGLRSTKLRPPGKNLIIIPNKTVASEAIVNNSRFARRRFEQVIGLTYDTTPDQMEAIVRELQELICAEPEVDPASVMVYFRDLSAASLDIWVVYEATDADFQKSLRLKQRVNLGMMRAIYARGLAFAYPTQTLQFDGPVARQWAGQASPAPRPAGPGPAK